MARIEFKDTEVKMDDLRGYCTTYFDPDKNPYRASELNDDEFNFISGMNYTLSRVTDMFLASGPFEMETPYEAVNDFVKSVTEKALQEFVNYGYCDLEQIMTSFIDEHEDEKEAE